VIVRARQDRLHSGAPACRSATWALVGALLALPVAAPAATRTATGASSRYT